MFYTINKESVPQPQMWWNGTVRGTSLCGGSKSIWDRAEDNGSVKTCKLYPGFMNANG